MFGGDDAAVTGDQDVGGKPQPPAVRCGCRSALAAAADHPLRATTVGASGETETEAVYGRHHHVLIAIMNGLMGITGATSRFEPQRYFLT
jgi:hypothetical protein